MVVYVSEDFEIPPDEINTRYKLFKKQMWEVKYKHKCEICNSRFDEFGFCGCGSGGAE